MIYVKTELGKTAMQGRSTALTARQRSAFIMFNGQRDSSEILKITSSVGVTAADVAYFVSMGLLALVNQATDVLRGAISPLADTAPAATSLTAALSHTVHGTPTLSAQEHYTKAYPIAIHLTAGLGLRGFRLNLAVEAAGDLDKLKEIAPKIKLAVGPEKYLELENALYY